MWDQWVDGRQQLHAWAELPMAALASLAAAAASGSEAGAEPAGDGDGLPSFGAAQSRLLPLLCEYDVGAAVVAEPAAGGASVAAAPAKGPALRVDLAYRTAKVLVPEPPQPARRPAAAVARRCVEAPARPAASGRAAHPAAPPAGVSEELLAALLPAAAQKRQPSSAAASGAVAAAAAAAALCGSKGNSYEAADEEGDAGVCGAENDVLLINSGSAQPLAAAPAPAPPSKGVEAVLSVEVRLPAFGLMGVCCFCWV